jgi:hypothetical protein
VDAAAAQALLADAERLLAPLLQLLAAQLCVTGSGASAQLAESDSPLVPTVAPAVAAPPSPASMHAAASVLKPAATPDSLL